MYIYSCLRVVRYTNSRIPYYHGTVTYQYIWTYSENVGKTYESIFSYIWEISSPTVAVACRPVVAIPDLQCDLRASGTMPASIEEAVYAAGQREMASDLARWEQIAQTFESVAAAVSTSGNVSAAIATSEAIANLKENVSEKPAVISEASGCCGEAQSVPALHPARMQKSAPAQQPVPAQEPAVEYELEVLDTVEKKQMATEPAGRPIPHSRGSTSHMLQSGLFDRIGTHDDVSDEEDDDENMSDLGSVAPLHTTVRGTPKLAKKQQQQRGHRKYVWAPHPAMWIVKACLALSATVLGCSEVIAHVTGAAVPMTSRAGRLAYVAYTAIHEHASPPSAPPSIPPPSPPPPPWSPPSVPPTWPPPLSPLPRCPPLPPCSPLPASPPPLRPSPLPPSAPSPLLPSPQGPSPLPPPYKPLPCTPLPPILPYPRHPPPPTKISVNDRFWSGHPSNNLAEAGGGCRRLHFARAVRAPASTRPYVLTASR